MPDQPKTFGGRLVALVALVDPPLPWRELDRLAGLAEGHCAPFAGARAETEPRSATIRALALVLGAPAEWLSLGAGKAPTAQRVARAVAAARAQHAPRVATSVATCKQ